MFTSLGVVGIELEEIQPAAYRLFYGGDGHAVDTLDLLVDEEQMVEQFEAREKGAGQQYRGFLKMARGALDLGMPNFSRAGSLQSQRQVAGRAAAAGYQSQPTGTAGASGSCTEEIL
jgi:hypothetical protein